MARRRWYRRSTRVVYPKKKWASNILQTSVTTSGVAEICKNSVQSASVSPTPVILKCGNFKVQGDVMWSHSSSSTSRPANLTFFLLFVPEGVAANDSLIGSHPEWVIGWKNIDISYISSGTPISAGSANNFSFSSRLKRNLNSGDRVIAILQSLDTALTATAVFTVQYWTCAN